MPDILDIKVENPVSFPLDEPSDKVKAAMHKAWQRQDLELYLQRWENAYVPDFPEEFWDFSWRACDVGSGFGKFSLEQSQLYPERAYLAIDKGTRRGGGMSKRLSEAKRSNLFGLHGNAIPILANMPDESLDLITLFYPNPWWPWKHRKKRWSYHPLLPKMIALLKQGGEILLAANEKFYLEEWRYALTHHPRIALLEEVYVGLIQVERGRTHFEQKFIEHGIACGEIRFRKV